MSTTTDMVEAVRQARAELERLIGPLDPVELSPGEDPLQKAREYMAESAAIIAELYRNAGS